MLRIAEALQRIKGRAREAVSEELILRLCRELGHRGRDRDLGPVVTTQLFLRQVLEGHSAVGELRRQTGLAVTDSASCQARARLPRARFGRLPRAVTGAPQASTEVSLGELWRGHRVFLIDGSSFSMPDTAALQEHFGQPAAQAEGCGFPVAHLMARFDARTGYLLQAEALPRRSHDLAGVPALHAGLCPGDVLVGDR